jgi:putative transposase
MNLEKGYIYHIYNQGNNRQKIFFQKRNYTFFLDKIKTHILPYGDILAYCLMPNHFHLMVLVRELELSLGASQRRAETSRTLKASQRRAETSRTLKASQRRAETSRTLKASQRRAETSRTLKASQRRAETSRTLKASQRRAETLRTLNESIGIMLMGYTKAINKQEDRTGKLFREKTKAECINCPEGVSSSFLIKEGVTEIIQSLPELQYPQHCFNYIHLNPVKARMVKNAEDWAYSSAGFYAGIRNDDIVNLEVAEKYIDINSGFRLKQIPE